jgi:hypothetical protein
VIPYQTPQTLSAWAARRIHEARARTRSTVPIVGLRGGLRGTTHWPTVGIAIGMLALVGGLIYLSSEGLPARESA